MTQAEDVKLKKRFAIWELIGQGWDIMKNNVWQILGLEVVLFLLYALLMGMIYLIFPTNNTNNLSVISAANSLSSAIVGYIFSLGAIYYSLLYADLKPVTFTAFFSKSHLILKYFLATIVYIICILVGLICLIIPGIIVAIRFSLYGYFIVDKEMGPIQALEESWNTVRGVGWKMLGFWLASILVNLAGLLCLGVGLLFSIPATWIAAALLYRTLWTQTNSVLIAKPDGRGDGTDGTGRKGSDDGQLKPG